MARSAAPDRCAVRLDVFVDAVFAFAVTLWVMGVGTVPHEPAQLLAVLRSATAFAHR